MSPKVYGHTYLTLLHYYNKYLLPEASCHWLKTCSVVMAMVMVGYRCVQSVVVFHPTIAYLQAKIVLTLINCLGLFFLFTNM